MSQSTSTSGPIFCKHCAVLHRESNKWFRLRLIARDGDCPPTLEIWPFDAEVEGAIVVCGEGCLLAELSGMIGDLHK